MFELPPPLVDNRRRSVPHPSMWACCLCSATVRRLTRDCSACGGQNCVAEAETPVTLPRVSELASRPLRASDMQHREIERVATGMPAWDQILGGGAAVPSSILVAGAAGVGKTTQTLRLASFVARARRRDALFISAEMPREMVVDAARRAKADLNRLLVWDVTDAEEAAAEVLRLRPACVVWDSIQALWWAGEFGTDASMRHVVQRAGAVGSKIGAVTVLICQVTKEGEPSGPNRMQHDVDTVLILERDCVRSTKSRHAPAPQTVELASEESATALH